MRDKWKYELDFIDSLRDWMPRAIEVLKDVKSHKGAWATEVWQLLSEAEGDGNPRCYEELMFTTRLEYLEEELKEDRKRCG